MDNNYHTHNNRVEKTYDSTSKGSYSNWISKDQRDNNRIGLTVGVIHGLTFALIGMGAWRIIITSIIIYLIVAGSLDVVKDIQKKTYNEKVLFEEVVGGIIAVVILLPIYLFTIISFIV